MSEEEKETKGLSRREFLKDAGLLFGGATVGSMAFVAACGKTTATTTTTTLTSPPTTVKVTSYIDPYDGQTFATQAALLAHMQSAQPVDTRITLNVNGTDYKVDIQPYWSLGYVLRENLGLTFLKFGCDRGECGHCTVIVDGKTVYSCLMLATEAVGSKVITAESLSPTKITLGTIPAAFLANTAFQCGFCTSGFMIAAQALLSQIPHPTLAQVQEGLSGHLCVCGAYKKVCDTVIGLGGG